mgnify:CR=1 FL=1
MSWRAWFAYWSHASALSPTVPYVAFDSKEFPTKSGKIEYRTDRTANVHITIGKTSFDEQALIENFTAIYDEIIRAKPSGAKGRYIKSITLASTMGPGIKVDPSRTEEAPAAA